MKTLTFFLTLLITTQSFGLTLGGNTVNFTAPGSYSTQIKTRTISQHRDNALLVKASRPLTQADKENIYALGVETITYTGDLSYIIYGGQNAMNAFTMMLQTNNQTPIIAIADMVADYKAVADTSANFMTLSDEMDITVLFLENIEQDTLEELFADSAINAEIMQVNSQLKNARVRISQADYQNLLNLPIVQFAEKSPQLLTVQ